MFMKNENKSGRYQVQRLMRGTEWVTMASMDREDSNFRDIANSSMYTYRILCGGADVTEQYKCETVCV